MTNRNDEQSSAYRIAQLALADLKSAVLQIVIAADVNGVTNAAVGRTLGIYQGHVGHEGHISRTLLAMLEAEGVVQQDSVTKRWRLCKHEHDNEGQAIASAASPSTK